MDLKDVYEELGRNYRFLAGWRHLTFAGGVAIWAGVLKVASDKGLASDATQVTCLAAAFGQIVLLMIDARTRDLLRNAVKQGAKLEDSTDGFFKAVDVKPTFPSHTHASRLFYLLSAAAFVILAVWF